MRIFPRPIKGINCDDDQFADSVLFVKRAQRVRNVQRFIAQGWLKKRRVPVVQVKHRIPVLIAIIVSRQEYVDCSLGIERALSSQRLIPVKISCDIATIMNNEIPMASPEIATLEHGLSSALRLPRRRNGFLSRQVPRRPRFVREWPGRIQGFAREPVRGSKEPPSGSV